MELQKSTGILTDGTEKVCPTCGLLLPTDHLICVACAEKRALKGALGLVERHLPDIAGGALNCALCANTRTV